ncbi:hypothetical protein Bpla01_23060 [Burkholderia plantarii]|nr:hypothetical protein Bpla01_23060 [Burkholderia plantarii]
MPGGRGEGEDWVMRDWRMEAWKRGIGTRHGRHAGGGTGGATGARKYPRKRAGKFVTGIPRSVDSSAAIVGDRPRRRCRPARTARKPCEAPALDETPRAAAGLPL